MAGPQRITISIYSGSYITGEEVIQLINGVPDEYKASIRFEAETKYNYDGGCPTIFIYYDRPETDEELNIRIVARDKQKKLQVFNDLLQLKELQEKYKDIV